MDVRDVMSRVVVTIRSETPLKEAVRTMDHHGVSGLPVVDSDGCVVGVLSEADVVVKEAGERAMPRRRFGWLFGSDEALAAARAKVDASTAGEAMTAPAITTTPDVKVRDAAATMLGRNINRLPVVEDGRLIGIVTRADIARAFLRADDEIQFAIREKILRHTLWVDPATVDVDVDAGVVHLAGSLDRRSTAELLERLTHRLDGVVRVESRVEWAFDDGAVEAPDKDLVGRPGI
jgi:CBS domain-containing protein